MFGDERHGFNDVAEHFVADEVVEVHPNPTGFDPLASAQNLFIVFLRQFRVDAEQSVTVRARARATAPTLDTKYVIQHCHHRIVVQVFATGALHNEGDNGEPIRIRVAENFDGRVGVPCCDGAGKKIVFEFQNSVDTHSLFELKHETGSNGFNDRGSAGFFPVVRIAEIPVGCFVDVRDRATADNVRNSVAHKRAIDDEHAWCAGPANELMR